MDAIDPVRFVMAALLVLALALPVIAWFVYDYYRERRRK
jgi:hypothetical protein